MVIGIMTRMRGGIMYDQRSIVLIPFPYSDLAGSKLRPALIISNEIVNNTSVRICCLVTSNESVDGIKIEGGMFEKGGLPFSSWVKPHRLFTIHEKIIKKELCVVSISCFGVVKNKLDSHLNLD